MGGRPIQALARVLFWRYPRGSWQYDVLCALIIAFIFLTPVSLFDGSYFAGYEESATGSVGALGDSGSNETENETEEEGPEMTATPPNENR